MQKTTILKASALLLAGTLVAPLIASAAEVITNGGFESGLSGWTATNATGSDGSFSLQSGTTSPVNGFTVPPPPAGINAAMSDGSGPGTHVLYQDFTINAPVGSATFSYSLLVLNQASGFFVPNPNTLDFGVAAFNQQARVDILQASSSPFSVSAADVLLNVFLTAPNSTVPSGYITSTTELGAFLNAHLNTPLRLRFAETDNVASLSVGADNVSLVTSAVPEPSSLFTCAIGLLVSGLFYQLLRRRKRSGD